MPIRMRHAVQALLLVFPIAFPSAPGAQASSGCADNFDAGLSKWTFLDADSSTGGSAVDTGGDLLLTGHGLDVFGSVNEYVAEYRTDITGDFDVSVKIISQTNSNSWAQAGIIAANDMQDLTQGGYALVDVSPGNGYTLFYDKTAPQGQLETHVSAGTTAYPVWLRLAKRSGMFSAWYHGSADSSWVQIAANVVSLATAANSNLALFSLSHNATAAATTVFDDFACSQGTVAILPRNRPTTENSPFAVSWKRLSVDGRLLPPASGMSDLPALILRQ